MGFPPKTRDPESCEGAKGCGGTKNTNMDHIIRSTWGPQLTSRSNPESKGHMEDMGTKGGKQKEGGSMEHNVPGKVPNYISELT